MPHRPEPRRPEPRNDAGQVTILLVGVMVVALLAAVGLARYGEAVVHRSRARTAADAVALAGADDPAGATQLERWYRTQDVDVAWDGSRAFATSGPSQAAAWARMVAVEGAPAPALVAIVARAEQLLGTPITPVQWREIGIGLIVDQGLAFGDISVELGLCQASPAASDDALLWFELC